MGVLRASVFGWFVLTVVGCTSAPAPSTPPAAPVASSAPFDVSAVIRQVQRSFREDGARWTTAGTGWALRTSEEGLELTAIHRPDAPLSLGLVGPQRRVESGAIRLGPTRLERGGWKQTMEGLEPERAHDGTLHLTGDGFVERLENVEVGLEQSWHFESAPGNDGDLVLTVPVTGASHRGTTATGEHLVDATSGLGFRIGHGTFIDAAGVETQVPVSFESGVLVLRVPETVLDRALFPAVLDPVISPEFGLDEPVPYADPPAPDGSPSVASNGDGYLIAWSDLGQRLYGETVLAVRVDSRGVLLDPSPLVVSMGAAGSTRTPHPRATSNGTDYLIVWRGEGARLHGVRVSATGAILDAEAFVISPGGVSDQPALASNGVDYLVAWSGCHATRVTAAGQVLDPASLTPGTDFPAYGPPAIASNSNRYLLMCPSERVEPTDGSVVLGFSASSVFFDGGFGVDGGAIVEADGLFGYGDPSRTWIAPHTRHTTTAARFSA